MATADNHSKKEPIEVFVKVKTSNFLKVISPFFFPAETLRRFQFEF
jgi:hypothetical protein